MAPLKNHDFFTANLFCQNLPICPVPVSHARGYKINYSQKWPLFIKPFFGESLQDEVGETQMSILHGRQEGKTSAAFANQHFPVILSLCYISNPFFSSKSSNYESGAWYRVQHSRLQELFSCKSRKFRISPSARTRSGGIFFKETEQDERRHRKIVGAE